MNRENKQNLDVDVPETVQDGRESQAPAETAQGMRVVEGVRDTYRRPFSCLEMYFALRQVSFFVFIVAMLAAPTLIFGFTDDEDDCQEGDRGGITLRDWCKGAGIKLVAEILILLLRIAMTGGWFSPRPIRIASRILAYIVVFWMAWVIWGVVILTTKEGRNCVVEGATIAIMTIINILAVPVHAMTFMVTMEHAEEYRSMS